MSSEDIHLSIAGPESRSAARAECALARAQELVDSHRAGEYQLTSRVEALDVGDLGILALFFMRERSSARPITDSNEGTGNAGAHDAPRLS